jgi:hypothetical protein
LDFIGLQPGWFAAGFIFAPFQDTPISPIKDTPFWMYQSASVEPYVETTRKVVLQLRAAGAQPIYTEYSTADEITTDHNARGTPAMVSWLLAQRRGMQRVAEPLLAITNLSHGAVYNTGAATLALAGTAFAQGQPVHAVSWTNLANTAHGSALGTNSWSISGIPLMADQTNVIIVTATTTSWAPYYGGNTTFTDTISAFYRPIQAALAMDGASLLLNWIGGFPPFQVQRTDDLLSGTWEEVLTNAVSPVTLVPTNLVGFYRIVGALP